MQIRETITVVASVERVFSVFADLESMQDRLSGVTTMAVLEGPGDPLAVGTRWTETRVMFGKEATETMWVTAVDAPHGYTVEAESCGTHYVSTFTFTPGSDNSDEVGREVTEAAMTFAGRPVKWWAWLMMPMGLLFIKPLRKALRQDMEDLKAVCEAGD